MNIEEKLKKMDSVIAEQSFRIKLNELKSYSLPQLQQIRNTVDIEIKTKQSELDRQQQQIEASKQRTKRSRISIERVGDVIVRKKS